MIKAVVGQNCESAIENFYCQYELLHNEVTNVFSGTLKLLIFLKKKNMIVVLIKGKGEKSCTITLEKLELSKTSDKILYGSKKSSNKKENMDYLLKKYSISKEEFCYIGRHTKTGNPKKVSCFFAPIFSILENHWDNDVQRG